MRIMQKLSLATATLFISGFFHMAVMAQSSPNFSGVWQLDLKASDSIDEIMKVQGFSGIERNFAAKMAVTQTITQTDQVVTITIKNPANTTTEELKLDGSEENKSTPRMGEVTTRSFWDPSGTALITELDMTTKDGAPAELIIRRYLEDNGNTMVQAMELKLAQGDVLKANRVFRKS
ncbi:MAG: hypothetical protein NW237_07920 [Cyanobacteriota bacterium]|nr:hypothetical protein [Cyanobacteriota bacterium]